MARPFTWILTLFLLVLAGSAQAQQGCPKCFSLDDMTGNPQMLREAATRAHEAQNPDLAFAYIQMLRTLYPATDQSKDAYSEACSLFKVMYRYERVNDPDGTWATGHMWFMFQWLQSFFVDGNFPQAEAERLLINMPRVFIQHWVEFADRPHGNKLAKKWEYTYELDNGRVQTLAARKLKGKNKASALIEKRDGE